jgi:hypothetical protein
MTRLGRTAFGGGLDRRTGLGREELGWGKEGLDRRRRLLRGLVLIL